MQIHPPQVTLAHYNTYILDKCTFVWMSILTLMRIEYFAEHPGICRRVISPFKYITHSASTTVVKLRLDQGLIYKTVGIAMRPATGGPLSAQPSAI